MAEIQTGILEKSLYKINIVYWDILASVATILWSVAIIITKPHL